MRLKRPILVGRGPWAQKLMAALPVGVQPTICGKMTALDMIQHARERGNDSVIVASALESHAELLVAASLQKLPVFCEKPMCASIGEAEHLEECWKKAGNPLFICDFTHLWSTGFEFAWARYRSTSGALRSKSGDVVPTPNFLARFGGPVRRSDCHPFWDYGSHAIAMALLLGIDLRGLKFTSMPVLQQWTAENDKVTIVVNVGDETCREATVQLGNPGDLLFKYTEGTWTFKDRDASGDDKIFGLDNMADLPLQRALRRFFTLKESDFRPNLVREGMGLPVQVTRVLETLCSSKSEEENAA